MSFKAKQSGLFNAQFTNVPKTKRYVLSVVVYNFLFVSLLFSLNGFAAGDILNCSKYDTWKKYHNLHRMIKTINNGQTAYNLASTALCMGKAEEGMDYLQKAADKGHIAATRLLGVYYETDYTFSSSEKTNNPENLIDAIYYYKKAISMIEKLPNYPEGSTDDAESIEYNTPTSFYLFSGLPLLYFRAHAIALNNMLNGNIEEVFYNDMLEILNKMGEAAINCLNRPALDIWKENKNATYEAQQNICSAYLEFVEATYMLEQQRIEADRNCTVPLKECTEHKKIVNKINHLAKELNRQANSAPIISNY